MSRFTVTEPVLFHLRAIAAQGGSLGLAAEELGTSRTTLTAAALDSPYSDEIKRLFPRLGQKQKPRAATDVGLRKLKPEQIQAPLVVPGTPQTRWLTKSWGVVA